MNMKIDRLFHSFILAAAFAGAMPAVASVSPLQVTSVEQTLPVEFAAVNDETVFPEELRRDSGGGNGSDPCGASRSPWTGLTSPSPNDKEFVSLGPGNRVVGENQIPCNVVEFDVGFDATSLSLLWGSPDTYNKLTLYSIVDGEFLQEVGSVIPSPQGDVPSTRSGAFLVTVTSSVPFNYVKVENTSNFAAFEFSNLIVGASAAGGDLECGGSVAVDDESLVLQRVDTGGNDCNTEVDFQLGFDGDVLTVLTDPVEGSAYLVELTWGSWVELPEGGAIPAFQQNPETIAGAVPLPAHTFGLDLGGDVEGATYLLDLCPGEPIIVADEIVGYDLASINDGENGTNDMSPKPGFQFACSARRTQLGGFDAGLCPGDMPPAEIPDAVCVGFDELIYIEGDWFSSRNLR